MAITLKELSGRAREYLFADPGLAGREKLRLLLEQALRDADFVAANVRDDLPQRTVLYHDPDLNFAILAHLFHQARETEPHDHGSSWAIYGQVSGESLIHDWAIVEPAAPGGEGTVRRNGARKLLPGQALLYNEGDIHSPSRTAPARLIRIEGRHIQHGPQRRWREVAAV